MAIQTFSRRFMLTCCLALIITGESCNDKKKKETINDIKITDVKQAHDSEPPPPPPPRLPDNPKAEIAEKCFINKGLKYETTIKIQIADTGITGTVTSHEIGNNYVSATGFTAVMDKEGMKVTFKGTPPPVGDASEWTTKPWQLRSSGKSEVLDVVFNAKDYNTNQWKDSKFTFDPCKQ